MSQQVDYARSATDNNDELITLTPLSARPSGYESLNPSELNASQGDGLYENLDPDKLLNAYGFGRYQFFSYILCEALNSFYSAAVYVMPYIQPNPVLECIYKNQTLALDANCRIVPSHNSSVEGVCGVVEDTELIARDPHYSTSLITEFGISCSSFVWKEAGLTAFTLGAVTMVPLMSSLADKYGRRPLMLAALTSAFVCHLLASFAPNYYIFILLRFLVGASSDSYLSLYSVIICELIPSASRLWIAFAQTITWDLGMIWVAILSLFVKKWRIMYIACAAPGILTILYYFWLPESPHWLIQNRKYREIENYIRRSNRWNKTEVNLDTCKRVGPPPKVKSETLAAILRNPVMLKLLLINGYLQFIMAFYYFGLTFLSVDLSKDRFTAFMLATIAELPAGMLYFSNRQDTPFPGGFAVIPLMLYAGRRVLCMFAMFIQGIALITATVTREPQWFFLVFVLIGKVFNSVTYDVHGLYVAEMAPTSVRSLFYSMINLSQSSGIILAPYLRHITIGPDYMKYVITGVLCIISGALCYFLPETKDRPLPADIKAASHGSRENSNTKQDNATVPLNHQMRLIQGD